jgi:hypothetical protein
LVVLDTRIGDDFAKAIAVALESNTTLTWINLSGMELFAVLLVDCCDKCRVGTAIGDDGAKAIEKALENNTTLKAIFLDGNCLHLFVRFRELTHIINR